MAKNNDPQALANRINCFSILENNVFELYANLAEKTEMPMVKSILVQIAIDSHKHSVALKGVAEKIGKPDKKPRSCERNLGETWSTIDKLSKEISNKERITREDWSYLLEKLGVLESVVGEEYHMLVELKTMQLMAKKINQIYNLDLSSFEDIFTRIIQEEETHRVLIEKIKGFIKREDG
jgi:rubrerythrin